MYYDYKTNSFVDIDVTAVSYLKDYILECTLSNGGVYHFDFTPQLDVPTSKKHIYIYEC